MGAGPIFPAIAHVPLGSEGLIIAFVVGTVAGLASGSLTALVLMPCEDLFAKIPIRLDVVARRILGVRLLALVGNFDPRVLGVGYETIHTLLCGELIGLVVIYF